MKPNGEVRELSRGLRLNIRDLHAGGDNRVRAVETPRRAPAAGEHLSGTRDPRTFFCRKLRPDRRRQLTQGHPASPGPSTYLESQNHSIPDGISQSECGIADRRAPPNPQRLAADCDSGCA